MVLLGYVSSLGVLGVGRRFVVPLFCIGVLLCCALVLLRLAAALPCRYFTLRLPCCAPIFLRAYPAALTEVL